MNGGLLWVNKDSSSTHLSRSSKSETARIRAHVQHLAIQSRSRRKSSAAERTRARNGKEGNGAGVKRRVEAEEEERDGQGRVVRKDDVPDATTKRKTTEALGLAMQQLTWLPSSTPEEKRSFLFFLKRTAQEWSGYRDVSFWNILVPQASAQHDAIFHSVIALGALHESLEANDDVDKEGQMQQVLLRQCTKAAKSAASGPLSHTIALMSCIIMVCLQNLQSNTVAFRMLRTGCNLVNDLERQISEGTVQLSRSEISLLEDYLKPILERLGTRYCFIVDLPSAFMLHTAAKYSKDAGTIPPPDLGDRFNTLLEARNTLEDIANWAMLHATGWDEDTGIYCTKNTIVQNLLVHWSELLSNIAPSAYGEHPGLQSSRLLLRAAGMVTKILFDTLGSSNECDFDRHLDKFTEIIEIYDIVSKASKARRRQKVSFGIDTGIIHTLAFVIGRCRDPVVRREALRLLERDDHVEGDMRASTGCNILRRLVELEENGRVITRQEDIPASQRVRIWEDQQFWHRGIVKVFYIRPPFDPALGAEFQEEWTPMPVRIAGEGSGSPVGSPKSPKEANPDLPNVVYGRGQAAFLDESTGTYHNIVLSSFFLPIPRM